jgi:hypothetical protein
VQQPDLVRACTALAPSGELAEHVHPETSKLALETLLKLHKIGSVIAEEDIDHLCMIYWLAATKLL